MMLTVAVIKKVYLFLMSKVNTEAKIFKNACREFSKFELCIFFKFSVDN